MLFSEPPPTPYDLRFSLGGIPVRVNPTFWLIAILPTIGGRHFDLIDALIWVTAVFISIVIHELGHAVAARSFGSFPSITLYGFGGLTSYQPSRLKPSVDPTVRSLTITLAGPSAGLALAGLLMGGLVAAGYRVELSGLSVALDERIGANVALFLRDMFFINLVWSLMNLLPVIPLDGGRAIEAILTRISGQTGYLQAILTSILVAGSVAVYGLVIWKSLFVTIVFAYLAFINVQLWQARQWRR